MRVTFRKMIEKRLSTWEAVRGKRTVVPGSTMALGRGGLPHDLAQMVAEATLGAEHGFWGCVAEGATFRSTGRKRTRPGREVILRHRHELVRTDHMAHEHVARWQRGEATPCADALTRIESRWLALGYGEGLVLEWPTLRDLGTAPREDPPVKRRRARQVPST